MDNGTKASSFSATAGSEPAKTGGGTSSGSNEGAPSGSSAPGDSVSVSNTSSTSGGSGSSGAHGSGSSHGHRRGKGHHGHGHGHGHHHHDHGRHNHGHRHGHHGHGHGHGNNGNNTTKAADEKKSNGDEAGGSSPVAIDDAAVRAWFSSLPSGRERAHALAISDPAFVRLVLELARRESASPSSATTKYQLDELTKLYDEYRSVGSSISSSSTMTEIIFTLSKDGNGKSTSVSTSNSANNQNQAEGKAKESAVKAPTTTKADPSSSGDTKTTSNATSTNNKGNTATTTSGATSSSNSTSNNDGDDATGTDDNNDKKDDVSNAFRIRDGASADDIGEKKEVNKKSGNGPTSAVADKKPILQYTSGLKVPVMTTTNSTAATTRAVLAAAERTKNGGGGGAGGSPSSAAGSSSSPSSGGGGTTGGTSPSPGKYTTAPSSPTSITAAEDDGDVSSTPSFSALGSGGGTVTVDVDISAEASTSAAATSTAISSKGNDDSGINNADGGGSAAAGSGGKKKKKSRKQKQAANKIVQAKQAAARALGKQGSTAEGSLLSHIRIVMHSALEWASADAVAPPAEPVLILDADFLASPSPFMDLSSKVLGSLAAKASFLSRKSDWSRAIVEAGSMSLSVLLLAKMEECARIACRAAGGSNATKSLAASSEKGDADEGESSMETWATPPQEMDESDENAKEERRRALFALVAAPGSCCPIGLKTLRKLLDVRNRVRAGENDEAVTMLTSKVHNMLVEKQCLPSDEFRLEEILVFPLKFLLETGSLNQSATLNMWNNALKYILPNVKHDLLSLPTVSYPHAGQAKASASHEKSVQTTRPTAASGDNPVDGMSPSKAKKKKKKKNKKKKPPAAGSKNEAIATDPNSQSAATICDVKGQGTKADNSSKTGASADSASNTTTEALHTNRGRSNLSEESLSLQQSLSAEISSVDSVSHESSKAKSPSPARARSITIDSGNNVVVGLGRMMKEEEHDDDGWATVPTKGAEKRNNNSNKKSGSATSRNDDRQGGVNGPRSQQQQQQHHSQQQQQQQYNQTQTQGKKKKKREKGRERTRKFVQGILTNILDDVEKEVDKRSIATAKRANEERRQAATSKKVSSGSSAKATSPRDVIVGASSKPQIDRVSSMPNVVDGEERGRKKQPSKKQVPLTTGLPAVAGVLPPSTATRSASKTSVDQKTAPTVPDTVSAGGTGGRTSATETAQAVTTGVDSSVSTDGTADVEPTKAVVRSSQSPQDSSPPLPNVLGTNNTISATSSVASSLEAPHATRHRPRGKSHELKEDDVGYHLIKLCDKLSDEMSVFMERRAMALSIRRSERAALLGALQESANNVFSGHSHVEMYGSCATALDLPSSDLDVVIMGLDDIDNGSQHSHGVPNGVMSPKDGSGKSFDNGDKKSSQTTGGEPAAAPSSESPPPYQQEHQQHHHHPQQHQQQQLPPQYYQYYPPPSPNGARVLLLAAELEMQPWAVQVKAIPTATVPVIKLLADPTRVPGGAMDWMMQPQHVAPMSPQAPQQEAAGMQPHHDHPGQPQGPQFTREQDQSEQQKQPQHQTRDETSNAPAPQAPSHPQPQPQTQQPYYNGPVPAVGQMPYLHPGALPWRGADIMNGLISIDITFEGPEHGGIGSTIFSGRFVGESCAESGLPPDATPAVQMIMVIKELLAQRRLNEPYSGGLSSFAVLLLAYSVVQERRIIQEEMERTERQRRAVEAPTADPKTSKAIRGATLEAHARSKAKEDKIWPVQEEKKQTKSKNRDKPPAKAEISKGSGSISSTSTPVTKPQPKSQSKQTQTEKDGKTATGDTTYEADTKAKPTSLKSEVAPAAAPTKTKMTAPAGANDATSAPSATKTQAPAKAPFSFKDALKAAPKPKAPPKKGAPAQNKKVPTKKEVPARAAAAAPAPTPVAPSGPKSWASIAKKKTQAPAPVVPARPVPSKADVAKSEPGATATTLQSQKATVSQGQSPPVDMPEEKGKEKGKSAEKDDKEHGEDVEKAPPSTPLTSASTPTCKADKAAAGVDAGADADADAEERAVPKSQSTCTAASAATPSPSASALAPSSGMGDSRGQLSFPQGSNDVLEVLCTGEPTAGKLLMHFLLFYGSHFESQATAVDVSGVHHPDFPRYRNRPYGSYRLSSYVPRKAGGSIDPVTGMYTVDPIVIYDPLEGCENNNVARSCFAWASIRSVFHQCYMTLSGAVERGSGAAVSKQEKQAASGSSGEDDKLQELESVLALLLSF